MKKQSSNKVLSATTTVDVHFYDVDSLGIVWHGHYLKYFENGREAFGKKFGVAYMDIYNNGYIAPIVDLQVRYLNMVALDEALDIETVYVPSEAAKLIFEYAIYKQSDRSVVARATTTQVFMNKEGAMEFSTPEFYRKWKEKWGISPEASGKASDVSGKTSDVSGKTSDVSGKASDVSGKASDVSGKASDASGKASDVSGKTSDASGKASEASGKTSDVSGKTSEASENFWELSERLRELSES
ncbi:MAG: thioesterase family protein, partial [Dysgonamonadaceae bacterium]|nr:thioesterase family protein [Dysgonamonadaceae bacterium]